METRRESLKMASGSAVGLLRLEKHEFGYRVTLHTALRVDSAELVEEREGDSGDSVLVSCMSAPSIKPMSKDRRRSAEMAAKRF